MGDATTTSRALVLGAGGNAGVAWELGLLAGLTGVRLNRADLVIGTSAGSIVASLLRSGVREVPGCLVKAVRTARAGAHEEAMSFSGDAFLEMQTAALATAGEGHLASRAELGRAAQRNPVSLSEEAWVRQIGALVPRDWPRRRLGVGVVDATDGSFRLIDNDSGVPLARAVAASCTVPNVFPLVTIDGRPYLDGGVRSRTNADAVAGYDRVLVVSCGEEEESSSFGTTLPQAVRRLRESARVLVITADEGAQRAFGCNVLDPSTQLPAFCAGVRQGLREHRVVRDFWR